MLEITPTPESLYKALIELSKKLPDAEEQDDNFVSTSFPTKSYGEVVLEKDLSRGTIRLEDNDDRLFIQFDADGTTGKSPRALNLAKKVIDEILNYQPENVAQPSLPEILNDVPVYSVHLGPTNDYIQEETIQGAIRRELEKLGLYKHDYLYTAFANPLLNAVTATGTYIFTEKTREAPYIYGNKIMFNPLTEMDELRHDIDLGKELPIYLSQNQDEPHVYFAVYDAKHFTINPGTEEYWFKDPENKKSALVAVVKIEDWNLNV